MDEPLKEEPRGVIKNFKLNSKNTKKIESINIISDIEKEVRIKYKETEKFKKVILIDNLEIFKKICKDNKNDLIDLINGERVPVSFNLFKKDYLIIRIIHTGCNGILIFYNDDGILNNLIGRYGSKVKSGNYSINNSDGGYILEKIKTQEDDFLTLSGDMEKDIIEDVTYFIENKKFYKDNKLTYKRGILMYGPPGNGKTKTIRKIIDQFKGNNIYSFIIDSRVYVNERLMNFIDYVSGKESVRFLIFEDIDRICSSDIPSLLNVLDGTINVENNYFIATCNDLSKVDKALLNRPSRFDKIYIIDDPDEKQREELLRHYFEKEPDENIKRGIELTNGFNCAFFKEIFLCSKIHKLNMLNSIDYIKNRLSKFKIGIKNLYTG